MPKSDLTKVDIRYAVTDSPVADLPWKVRCPHRDRHSDSDYSLAVYPGHVHCFGCGFHIPRRMDALAFLLNVPVLEAIKLAPKYTNEALDAYRERAAQEARRDPMPRALAGAYSSFLYGARRKRLDWLYDRGLTDETLALFHIGHDGTRFTIPFFSSANELISIRYRLDPFYGTEDEIGNPLPKYMGTRGRNGLYLYPEHFISRDHRNFLVICEGEFDALRLIQEGIPAVSATNGAGNVKHIPRLIREISWGHYINNLYFATDMDEAGEAAARETMQIADEMGFKCSRYYWPRDWGKDVSELYQGGHTLSDIKVIESQIYLSEVSLGK